MNRVVFTPGADGDYRSALAWYARQSRSIANGFVKAVERSLVLLSNNPKIAGKIDDRHRALVINKYPYLLIHRFDDPDTITIIAIVHSHRDPESWVPDPHEPRDEE